MRLLDIDKVIEALRSDYNNGTRGGVDYDQTDAAAFEDALLDAWAQYGVDEQSWDLEKLRLKKEVRHLNELLLEYEQHRVMMDNKYGELADWLIMLARKVTERVEAEVRNEAD